MYGARLRTIWRIRSNSARVRVELLLVGDDLAAERGQSLRRLVDLGVQLGEHLLVLAHLVGEGGEGVRIRLRHGRRTA